MVRTKPDIGVRQTQMLAQPIPRQVEGAKSLITAPSPVGLPQVSGGSALTLHYAQLDEAVQLFPEEPLIVSLLGVYWALVGNSEHALECVTRACSSGKSFGHAHHMDYQIACIFSLLGRRNAAFEWLERAVNHGFACWPFFLKDTSLENLRNLPEFESLVSSLQGKYPDHLGLL